MNPDLPFLHSLVEEIFAIVGARKTYGRPKSKTGSALRDRRRVIFEPSDETPGTAPPL